MAGKLKDLYVKRNQNQYQPSSDSWEARAAELNNMSGGAMQQGETAGNGVLGWLKDSADAGFFSSLGGTARLAGEFMPFGNDTLNSWADKADEIARRNSPQPGQNLEGADYIASAVGNALGSGGASALEAGAVAALGSLLGVGGAAGAVLGGASKVIPGVGKAVQAGKTLWGSPVGKYLVANVAGSPFEAGSEAGNLISDMRKENQQGTANYTDDEIREAALRSGALNLAWLAGMNMLEAGTLGKITGALGGKMAKDTYKGIAGRALMGGTASGIGEGAEEYGQNLIGDYSKNGRTSDFNYDEAWEAAKMGAIGGGVLGGLGSGLSAKFSKKNSDVSEEIASEDGGNIEDTQTIDTGREAFINAIAGQESGGDYEAENGDTGAYGKYQIMPENWAAWAEEAGIGADAPRTPENQEIVARFKLGQYYDKYGARGAAIAWYGGEGALNYSDEALSRRQGDNGEYPSINEYADEVLGRMGNIADGARIDDSEENYFDEGNYTDDTILNSLSPARGFDVSHLESGEAQDRNSLLYGEKSKGKKAKQVPGSEEVASFNQSLDNNKGQSAPGSLFVNSPRSWDAAERIYAARAKEQAERKARAQAIVNIANAQQQSFLNVLRNRAAQQWDNAEQEYKDRKQSGLQSLANVINARAAQKWDAKEADNAQKAQAAQEKQAQVQNIARLLDARAAQQWDKVEHDEGLKRTQAQALANLLNAKAAGQYDVAQQVYSGRAAEQAEKQRQQQAITDIINARAAQKFDEAETAEKFKFVPQRQSMYDGAMRRNLAAQNRVQPDALPSVEPTPTNHRALDGRNFLNDIVAAGRADYANGKRIPVSTAGERRVPKMSADAKIWLRNYDSNRTTREFLRDAAAEVWNGDPKHPMKECRRLLNSARAARKEILQPIFDNMMQQGYKQGVEFIPIEDRRTMRESHNPMWYRNYYKENAKAPSKTAMYDIAEEIFFGRDKYGVGYYAGIDNAGMQQIVADNHAELDPINKYIEAYETLELKLKENPNYGKEWAEEAANKQTGQPATARNSEAEQAEAEHVTESDKDEVKETAEPKAKKSSSPKKNEQTAKDQQPQGKNETEQGEKINLPKGTTVDVSIVGDNSNIIQVKFNGAQGKGTDGIMGRAGYKWNGSKKIWQARKTEKAMDAAEQLGYTEEAKPQERDYELEREELWDTFATKLGIDNILSVDKANEELKGVEGLHDGAIVYYNKANRKYSIISLQDNAEFLKHGYKYHVYEYDVNLAGTRVGSQKTVDEVIDYVKDKQTTETSTPTKKPSADTFSKNPEKVIRGDKISSMPLGAMKVIKDMFDNGEARNNAKDAIRSALFKSKDLEASARNNTYDNFKIAYFDAVENYLVEHVDNNPAYAKLLESGSFAKENMENAAKEAYNVFRVGMKKKAEQKQTQEAQEPAKRFDGERARKSLDALIGRKKKSEPQKNDIVPKSKFMNVFNEDELDAEIEKAKKEMSKLSANPMFNPALMKSLFKIGGIYLQKGVNKFAAWADNMVDVMGEKVRPFLPAVWDSLKKYPDNQKFNDDVMTAVMEYVGEGVDNGKSLSAIKREFADDYGDEYLGYVDAAFEGIKKYPTSDNAENVVKSKQDNTEGGSENGQRNGTSGEVGNSGLGRREAEENSAPDGRGQKVQTGMSGQTETRPRDNGESGAGRPSGLAGAMGVPASEHGGTHGERGTAADNGGTSLQQGVQEQSGSGEAEESRPTGEDAENGGRGELSSSVPRRRINKGSYSILENGNYHANNEDALLGNGKHEPAVRFSVNLKAIEALRRWQEDGIEPTPEEKDAMAHYSGWGGMKKFLFEGTWENPEYASGEWKEANDKLRKALGKEAWETAWLNVSNQYYTPPSAITKMWNLATRLGFKGGKVLEPSMGVGNFYALMPAKLQKEAVLTGVEIDPIAGEMAKVLYPDAHIFVQGYEKHAAPENFYDLIIGNVPFGENTLKDSKYSGKFADPLQIHDFFLVKNIGQLQPGGILMAITTHNSLDKINTTVRSHIARKAELVGAIRLPNGTFNGTGTDVMTDLLVFKKRDKEIGIEEAINLPWVKTFEQKVRYSGQDKVINVNKYFKENPQMVAGKLIVKSGKFGPELGAIAENTSEAIDKAIENFPKNIIKKTKSKAENEYVEANQKVKDKGLYYNSKGDLVYRDGIQEKKVTLEDYRYAKNESQKLLERRKETVNSLMGVYDKYSKLIEAEKNKAPNLEQVRKEALEAFENHVNTYGYYVKYSKRKDGSTKTTFAKELKFFNDLGDAEKFIDLSALDYNNKPAPILLKKVTTNYQMGAPTVANAYLKQLFSGNQKLDIAQIAKDANTTESQVVKELIDKNAAYKTPNGEYQPTNIYLSGNVVEKLKEAQAAYDLGDKSMKRNIDALTAIRPKLVSYVSITAKMGVPWVETKDYEDFIASLLNAQSSADIGVHVENKAGAWKVKIDSKAALNSPYATEKYGMQAPFVDFTTFLEAAMNKKEVSIKKPVYKNGRVVSYEEDPEGTKKAAQKVEQIQNAFTNWLWNQDADRKVRMELAYNDTMNAIVPPVFDARLMQFDGLINEMNGKPFDPRIHQRNFVLRALLNGRGGAYHEAGTGKTLIMSMLCMELRRSGKANKPLILAHNANAAQVAKDIKTFYPTSKVLYIPKFSGGKNSALSKRLVGQIKSGNWDAVVIPHSAISKIAFSEETLKAVKNDELEAIKENIRTIANEEAEGGKSRATEELEEQDFELTDDDKAALKGKEKGKKGGGKFLGDRTRRAMLQYKKLLLDLQQQAENYDKPDYIPFDTMGIDAILVDECHVFKKAPKITKRQIKGVDTQTSEMGFKMSCLTDYINMKNDNKGVFLFSGTMITNTIPEIHTMMRFVMPDTLKQANIYNLDDFLNTFTGTTNDIEPTSDGTWEPVERLTQFYNITELKRIAGQDFDIVTTKGLPGFELRALPNGKTLDSKNLSEAEKDELLNGRSEEPKGLPNFKIQNIVIPKTKRTKAISKAIQKAAQKWKEAKKTDKAMLQKEGYGLKLQTLPSAIGMSLRNLDSSLRDTPNSKVNMCVRNVMEIYDSHPKACQVIFTEKGYNDTFNRTHNTVEMAQTPKGPRAKIVSSKKFELSGYNLVNDIKAKLIEQGVPENEIAVIDGSTNDDKRADIAERVSAAEIRIVIGSSKTLGVGVNMQKNLRAAHHLDAVWMPGDLDQMNKRSKRQGNCWNTVYSYRYIAPGYDGKMWSALSQKQAFISAFTDTENNIRIIDSDALSTGDGEENAGVNDIVETLTNAIDDVRVLQKAKLKNKLDKYADNEVVFRKSKAEAAEEVKRLQEKEMPAQEAQIQAYKDDYKTYKDNKSDKFVCKIKTAKGWVEFKERAKAEGVLRTLLKTSKGEKYCEYNGFNVTMESIAAGGYFLTAHGANGNKYSTSSGTFAGLSQLLANIPKRIARTEDALKKNKETVKIKQNELNEKSPYAEIVDTLQQKLNSLEKDMQDNPIPAPEWFRLKVPIDTFVEYNGKNYLVTGYSVKYNDQPYSVIGTYVNDDGKEIEAKIPANKAMIDGFPVLTDEEMEIDPKKEILDETDDTPELQAEIDKAVEAVDRAFSTNPYYRNPRKATLTIDGETIDITKDYQDKGDTQYSVSEEASTRSREEVEAEIRAAFPNGKVEYVNGVPTITMPNGSKFQYSIRENIIVNAKEQRKADAAHGTSGARVQGFWKKFSANGVQRMLAVSQRSERGTAFHEAMHAAIDLVLTEKEKNALYNYYEKKAKEQNRDVDEVIADAYRDWVLARQRKSGTMFGKLWRKVKDFCTRIKALFDKGAEVERIMQDIESGRVYERGTNNHSVTKRISFSKEEIQGQKGSGTTQVATTRTMYVKALKWLRNQHPEAKTVLDYGAGLGLGTDDMRSNNPDLNIDSYEPNPERWAGKEPPTYTNNTQINKDYDLILNTNVLNVVEKPIRDLIVKDIADHLNMGGKAIITTRGWSNDVNAAKNFKPADEHHAIWINKGKNGYVFQKGFDGDELKNYIQELLGDEFVVEKTRPTFGKSSVTITRVKDNASDTQNTYSDTESINPNEEYIQGINDTDAGKVNTLAKSFEDKGYVGRPVLLVENGNEGYIALTGSHRIEAAKQADVDLKAIVLENNEDTAQLIDARDDDERENIAKQLYEEGAISKSAYDIIREENANNDAYYSVASPKHKIANAFTNTERKGVVDSVKDFFKEHRKSLYDDWWDKNNPLKGFDALTKATGGLSVYEQAQSLPATTAGMLKALTEGTAQHVKMANQHLKKVKMKYNVTLAMALDKINKKHMDKAHPNYLEQNGFDSWVNAFGAYLGAERCLEMAQLARAEGKSYKFPKGLTESECREFSKNAPAEFKAAADIFYKVNDNMISIMEDAQVFDHKLAQTLRTKYKKYCPLLRDFSDTAAADSFIGGLTEGGRGIGNVSVPLKRINIEGSERGVLNPLETILKSYAVMLNRAERNKVALMAVKNAKDADLHELIEEVPGTTADPKNCVFTVLINGKKKAFKTTQDLYGPIVGYNLPAAGLMFGVARTTARMLRTGATMSPSFIVRNFLRDTVFAGIASKNGFIPIVDSIRGAIALAKDPAMRAEFEAAGVTEFNFYSSQKARIKSLDAMAGETPTNAWELIKAAFSNLEAASDFVESSTRMGEYMKARKNNLSMEEAARAAREVTIDFSRSGRLGEQVNQVVPFFNACLQGGDKLVRLFREDFVGTSLKVTGYIIFPSLLIMAMNWDKDWYKDLDPDIKNNYWCLGRSVRIPKPQEAGVLFGSGIEALFQQAAGKDKDAVSNFLEAFRSNMLPNVLPTLILPLIEWSANYSFYKGRPLVSNKYSRLPDELQYNDYTSELSKGIGGVLKVSPMKIDNLVRGYTGTMGALLWSAAGEPFAKANNLPAKHFNEMLFVRDFNVTDANLSRPMNEFYGILDKANRQHAGYGVKGKPEAAVKGIRSAGSMIGKIRKDIDKITHSNLSPERKRELIDKRKDKMNQIAKKATERYGKYFD